MRRSLGALTLAAALMAGCGSGPATPSPPATAVATTRAPTSTPTPTLGPTATLTGTPPSPTPAPPTETVTLPTGAVRTLPTGTFALQGDRAFTLVGTAGPVPYPLVGNGSTGLAFTIRMVNVATGTSTVLASRPAGREPSTLTVVGDRVVWVESWYAHPQPNVGGETGGNLNAGQPLLWQIDAVSITTGVRWVIASGSNTRIPVEGEAAGALAPVLAADGDRVAYTLDRSGPGGTDASAIIVRSLSSGAALRRIDADGYVAQVGLVGQALFFREAFDSGTPGSVYPADASLMLSRSDGEPPRLIDRHVIDAAMDAQTLVWSREDATDASIWAASLASELQVRVQQGPPFVLSPGQTGPTTDVAVGSGLVGWTVWYPGADGSWTSALVVWQADDPEGRVIAGQRQPDWLAIEDGSLLWRESLPLPGHPDTHAALISAIP